ncbi:MAG: DUF2442 domain-containing protein [Stomatobaculum sp.]|nr:DUF2442 domain-containing protein [Stomatobaculum sp.]
MRLRPTVISVFPLSDYHLQLEFDNGEKKIFDVKPYISGSWYGELKDPDLFNTVFANGYTVEWKNGQDLCPDELYYNSKPL